jgi:ferredoxin
MRVLVDHSLCEGNGRCVEVAPEVFELREDDRSYVRTETLQQPMRGKVELAVRLCPRQAISIRDN